MKAKLLAFLGSLKNELVDTWERSKMWILAIAGVIAAIEFRKIQTWLLAYLGQRQIQNTQKTDAKIQSQESQESKQADDLVEQADSLPSQEQPVTDDWYKNN